MNDTYYQPENILEIIDRLLDLDTDPDLLEDSIKAEVDSFDFN